jgi:hypothetical protein
MDIGIGSQIDGEKVLYRRDTDHSISESDRLYQPSRLSRAFASFTDVVQVPFGYGGRVRLPLAPNSGGQADAFDEKDLSSTKSSRQRTCRRYLIIGTSITLWLLLVVIYVADVNRSWLALEDKWKVS